MSSAPEGFYHCNLGYPDISTKAVTGYGYAARADEHADRTDHVLHIEHGNMPSFAAAVAGAPEYWISADQYSRSNARRFFTIEGALPRELDLDQQITLSRGFANHIAAMSDNLYAVMPYMFGIHAGYGRQPHVHFVISPALNDGLERPVEQWFRRHNPKRPEAGGAPKCRVITKKSWLLELRRQWERYVNEALRSSGSLKRVDHRSYVERGINRIPKLPVGPPTIQGLTNKSREMRLQRNREIDEENLRRAAEELRIHQELAHRARNALLELPGYWWGQHRRSTKVAWKAFRGQGVGVLDRTTCISRKDKWARLGEIVQESAYTHAANNWLGDDWVASTCGPITVWLHPTARPLIDCGGAICTTGKGTIEAGAIATLLHTRGTESVQIKGPPGWVRRLMNALTQLAIRTVPTNQSRRSIAPAESRLPAPAPKGLRM